jgi:hypothetical protein
MSRGTQRVLVLALVSGAGVGCAPHTNEFENATPDTSGYTLEITGDAKGEGLSTASLAADGVGVVSQGLTGALPEYLQDTREAVRALNDGVRAVIDPIVDLVATHPLAAGDKQVWGPKDRGTATYRFIVARGLERRFGWLLQAKPIGAPDSAYQVVMGGVIVPGDLPHRGRGAMGVDLDKLSTIDTTVTGRGQLLVGFAHVLGFKVLKYALHQFTPDPAQFAPIDALFGGWRGPQGRTEVKVAVHANLEGTATAAAELAVLHARWLPGVGGRVDAVATSGDVPAGKAVVAFQCFNKDCGVAGSFTLVSLCDIGAPASCVPVKTDGVPANCANGLTDDATPASDPMADQALSGAPEDPPLPSAMPDGSA